MSELLKCNLSAEELPRSLLCRRMWAQLLNLWTKFLFDLSTESHDVEFPFLTPGFSKKQFEFFYSVQVHGWSKGV